MPDFIEMRSSDKDTSHGRGLDEIAREGARRMAKVTRARKIAATVLGLVEEGGAVPPEVPHRIRGGPRGLGDDVGRGS
jgi:hypothetical protein